MVKALAKTGQRESTGLAPSRTVLEMSHSEARRLFLKPQSYCNVDLPPYITFGKVLEEVDKHLLKNPVTAQQASSPRDCDGVNHLILNNKDGKYAWRPLQLCHPALYIALVHELTTEPNWSLVKRRLKKFSRNQRVQCLSLPVKSQTKQSDRAEQVMRWWHEIEQRSIELSLDFEVLIHADVTDCYGSLYTHSVSWAFHTKKIAKSRRRDLTLVGNVIDSRIQDMCHGQTNGIPQGSVLMDFIAEMVLGYADMFIGRAINRQKISDYRILRYRDDYRIFANSSQDGERILKCVSEALARLGLKLNTSKTVVSRDVISDSIKPDKWDWLSSVQENKNFQKHLLLIHDHGTRFPNSGSLVRALTDYHRKIITVKKAPSQLMQLISITVDIAYHSPKVYPVTMAILSKLLSLIGDEKAKKEIVVRILKKFSGIPNTGYLEIWLQRAALAFDADSAFREPVCKLVRSERVEIWNNEWISSKALKKLLDAQGIVDQQKLKSMAAVIPETEVRLFELY